MNDKEFVEEFYKLKESLVADYLSEIPDTAVAKLVQSLTLNGEQKEIMKKILDTALTDALYTILLGLEGSATIGQKQETYKVLNEEGMELTGKGIEEYAWEYFQNQ